MNIEKADDKVSCISLRWLISLDGSEVVCSDVCSSTSWWRMAEQWGLE
jgi:hypothetical protein